MWKRVAGNKMKGHYSSNIKLTRLIRMAIGLPYVPIENINSGEALSILKEAANSITGVSSVKKFAKQFVKYIEDVWINRNYPPTTWNYYLRRGVNTNNFAEGKYNLKLKNKLS